MPSVLHNPKTAWAEVDRLSADPQTLRDNWCLPPQAAKMVYLLAKLSGARRVLEVGTSIGYSTLHLALGVSEIAGQVTCIDASADRMTIAKKHFETAGLKDFIHPIVSEAIPALENLNKQGAAFDLAFLDAQKAEYLAYLRLIEPMMSPGGLLIADNTQSHRSEMQPFITEIMSSPAWEACDVETPNGFILARKR